MAQIEDEGTAATETTTGTKTEIVMIETPTETTTVEGTITTVVVVTTEMMETPTEDVATTETKIDGS